jgi:hypothetical protein
MVMKQSDKEKIIKVYILADIIEGYLIDLQPHTTYQFKRDINILIKHSKNLTKFVDKNLNEDDQESFGILSDKFKKKFEEIFNIN